VALSADRLSKRSDQLVMPVSETRDHIRESRRAFDLGSNMVTSNCPTAYPIVEAVREQMGDDLRFGFRHFPAPDCSSARFNAALAAEAAGAQRRF
jgi:hypothetical protein